MEYKEISKEDLTHLTLPTLVSFFDLSIEKNHFEFSLFKPFFEAKNLKGIAEFSDTDAIQIEADFINLSVNLVGSAKRQIRLTQIEDIIDFVHYFCKVTCTHFLLSYNDILLNYEGV